MDTRAQRLVRVRRFVRTRRGAAATGLVLALLAGGVGTWATDTWPFDGRDRYCWGAWQEDSGPGILGDEGFEGDDDRSRTSTGTAPTSREPRGECRLSVTSSDTYNGDKDRQETTVTVTYGPAPRSAGRRVTWLGGYLGDRAMPLPDGLPGVADGSHGLLVLPKRCDTRDGRPTAVTLDAREAAEPDDVLAAVPKLGGSRDVAELLVAAANKGMEAAGCADGEPLRVSGPVPTLPEREESFPDGAVCRIPGLDIKSDLGKEAAMRLRYQVGAVDDDLQSCSARIGRSVRLGERVDQPLFDAVMVREPRISALLDGATGTRAPEKGWRGTGTFTSDHGVVRADCAGRPTSFLLLGAPTKTTSDYFATFTNAVARRLGCAPVAPAADTEGSGR
ncbi:hypothetical protein [Streptomyces flavofungini]|uniref:hypothetical protein n=1 Tax=Streptomyces flavofungini TaxID=68200 RepID=UPI0025B02359|nr:hypothetical protein [Streptomyces flavofungini]WJV45380.1 hypothetical protein QUY26_07425 [Streptomyces flavofungini]